MTAVEKWLANQWAEETARTLQSMTDARPSFAYESLETSEAEKVIAGFTEGASITAVEFTFGSEATMWLAFPQAAVEALGKLTLTAAGIEDAGPDEIRNTCLEIVQQAHAGLAQAISRRVQNGVVAKGVETLQFPNAHLVFKLELSFPDTPFIITYFTFSPGLLDALSGESPSAAAKPVESRPAPVDLPAPAVSNSKTLDVLLEVSMPVSVSFGRTEMLIKEVLKLTTGSIVELNRNVSEPVEVIVNDCVIARGEVVVVDGNYGVRIQQIVSLQERFRTSTKNTKDSPGKTEVVLK